MKNLIDKINSSHFDYKEILKNNIFLKQENNEDVFINVVVPVRERKNFLEPLFLSLKKAQEKISEKIVISVVEHSFVPDHSKFCKKNKINYIWIKSEQNELFNKCLCFNLGALFFCEPKYFLFHDLDCVVNSNFFIDLLENIKRKEARAIQCFTGRRVLYCNEELTQEIISNKIDLDTLSLNPPRVSLPMYIGAPGGSIMIERSLFFDVGGYDDDLFLANSPEDSFFWEKVDFVGKMYISDDPNIEIFHLNHPPTYYSNPRIDEMKSYLNTFKALNEEQKMEIISLKKQKIKIYE